MTTKKRRFYSPPVPKTTMLDCLDQKSLDNLRAMGYDPDSIRAHNQAKDRMPAIVDKIRKNIKSLDRKTLSEIKTMCYIGCNPATDNVIVRPFTKKITELYDYVNNNPAFRSSH